MRVPLTIAVAQPHCTAHDVAANARAHADAVRAAGARVVVFPEMSLTGYELDAAPLSPADERLAALSRACAETGTVALAGAPVREGDREYIGMIAVRESTVDIGYRKVWPGGAEPDRFAAGPGPVVLEVDGWRLGLAICRDTGIPEHARDTAALGIDAYVAGVLESAEDVTVPEERARRVAADHHVWVVVASFAGPTGGGYPRTAARSRIWDPDGRLVADAGTETGAVARATLTRVP